jgi:tetratricopeptide (TPR) repeat protein
MEFRLLGPVRAQSDGQPVDLGVRKQRLVLAVLALDANRFVATTRLVDACWPDEPPPSARRTVHTHISRLRAVLAGAGAQRYGVSLDRLGSGYLLGCDLMRIDVYRFRALVERARGSGDDEERAALLEEALTLWHGSPLADVADEATREQLCQGLEEARLGAMQDRFDAWLRLGRHLAILDELVKCAAEHPRQQRFVAQLMLALYRAGRAADALEIYQRHRRRLVDDFGIDPGTELRRLEVAILRSDPILDLLPDARLADMSAEPVHLPSMDEPEIVLPAAEPAMPIPAQLPGSVADFTGRAAELRRLDNFLLGQQGLAGPDSAGGAGATVVTVTGMAGVGKTALAVHWGHRVADQFRDGQLYVDLRGYAALAPVRPIEALAQFLRALGVPAERVPTELDEAAARYRSLLAHRRMLVLLDNAGSADQVRPLLPGSAACRVLITSRDRLGGLVALEGARRVPVTVFDAHAALTLLTRIIGAGRVRAEPEAAAELARLCAYLPLALRIAGGNLLDNAEHTIVGYLARLGEGSRLAALEIDGDQLAAVRATFDLSYDAQPPDARRLFRLLGLVPGPDFTAEAAAALAGTSVALAGRLLDRLAGVHLLDQHSPARYRFHDLLRLYARERADQEESRAGRAAARQALFDWYLHGVDAAARLLYPQMLRLPVSRGRGRPPALPFATGSGSSPGPDDATGALAWVDGERANLVAVVMHAERLGAPAVAWRLADQLRGYFWLRRHTVDWLAVAQSGSAAAQAGGDLPGQAAAALNIADAHQCLGRVDQAIDSYREALELTERAHWPEAQAAALGNLGIMYYERGALAEAAEHYSRALELDRRIGWRNGEAVNLGNLATVHRELGKLRLAAQQYRQALVVFAQTGARYGEADATSNLGLVCHELGQLPEALDHLERALRMHREIGERYGEANTLNSLAALNLDLGRPERALDLAQEALAVAREIGGERTEAEAMSTLAAIEVGNGEHQRAIEHYRQALAAVRQTGIAYPEVQALIGLVAAHSRLGRLDQAFGHAESALVIARSAGLRMLEGQALSALAGVHLERGETQQAIDRARQALAVHRETGHEPGEARTVRLLSSIVVSRG